MVASRRTVEAGPAASVPPAASAQLVLRPVAEVLAEPCGRAAPRQVAAAESDARVRPREEAVAALAVQVPLPEAAAGESDAAALLPAVGAAVPGGEAVQPPGVVALALRVAEVQRPEVGAAPVAWGRRQAAVHPSAAPWVCRPGQALPWPAPRRAVRSAHAMRRSRAASPSKQLWQAARCEGLS